MATKTPEPTDALFVADVPVNAHVRIPPLGDFKIVSAAGESFTVPIEMASAFASFYGPQRGNSGVSAAAREAGRIPGLRRVG